MERSDSESPAIRCAAVRKLVYEFIDCELPPTDAASVDQHLTRCPPCAGFFSFERAFLRVLKGAGSIEGAPAELRERIRSALERRERSGSAE